MRNLEAGGVFSPLNNLIDWSRVGAAGRGYMQSMEWFGIRTNPCPGEAECVIQQLIGQGLDPEKITLMGVPSKAGGRTFEHVWVAYDGGVIDSPKNRKRYEELYKRGVVIRKFMAGVIPSKLK